MSFLETIVKDVKTEAHHLEASVESSALWKAAYEYRVPEAAVAVGGALLATAIVCTRSEGLARFLAQAPKVLLLEDTPGMARALRDGLHSQGLRVSWYRGANAASAEAEHLWGKMRFGSIPLDLKKYQYAVVDGDLGKKSLTGDQIVPRLRNDNPNMFIVGSSSQPDMNIDMQKAGADLAARKEVLVGLLASNRLPLSEALAAKRSVGSVADVQKKIDYITDHHSAPEYKPVWKSARTLVEKYMIPKKMRNPEKDN
jgi:CheY-like chemotaxis protein